MKVPSFPFSRVPKRWSIPHAFAGSIVIEANAFSRLKPCATP